MYNMSTRTRLVCKTRPYLGADVTSLDGTATAAPRWYDAGCASAQQSVTVLVKGVGISSLGARLWERPAVDES